MLYRHYKGGLYVKVADATHSETGEAMIVYQHLKSGKVWVRPASMFNDTMLTYNGERLRFQPIGELVEGHADRIRNGLCR